MTVEEAREQTAAWLTSQGVENPDVSHISQDLIGSYGDGAQEPDAAELAEWGEKNPEGVEGPQPRPPGTEDLWVNYGHNLLWMGGYLLWQRVANNGRGPCTSETHRWNNPV